ncbi:MAG: hypothetical protein ACKO8Q_07190, partial [Bacteroidota bacterium]
EKPKPDTPPTFNPKEEKPETEAPTIQVEEVELPPAPAPKQPEEKPEDKPTTVTTEQSFGTAFQYQNNQLFGNDWKMIQLKGKWPTLKGEPNPSSITTYWTSCSEQPYDQLVGYLQAQKQILSLSDWGVLQMLTQIAEGNFSGKNNQNLFVWFTLVQLGYDARIMYSENQVVLTLPFEDMLYGKSYFEFSKHKYFVLDDNHPASLYTYSNQHESAKNTLNLSNNLRAKYPNQWETRNFKFRFNNKEQLVELPYMKYRVAYNATIPQTELDYYFGQPLATAFTEKLHEALDKKLAFLPTEREKVRYLYALVCQSIPYKTDQDQFNIEKFCLPEEVLAYPYADCEDRTFLLNALLVELVGVETIGLNYPGHVAMAVKLKEVQSGDALIQYNGEKYVYCDPTYIGADVGMMPNSYERVRPEIMR